MTGWYPIPCSCDPYFKPTNVFSYEAFSEATMLTDDFSTPGLAEDWFESECNVFNSFAVWMSESLDSINDRSLFYFEQTAYITINDWYEERENILNIQQIWNNNKCFYENTGMFI